MNVNTINAKTLHRKITDFEKMNSQGCCLTCLESDYHALGCPERCKCKDCDFADSTEIIAEFAEQVAEDVVANPERHRDKINEFLASAYDDVLFQSPGSKTQTGIGFYFLMIVDETGMPKIVATFSTALEAVTYGRENYTAAQKPTVQFCEVQL